MGIALIFIGLAFIVIPTELKPFVAALICTVIVAVPLMVGSLYLSTHVFVILIKLFEKIG